MDVWERTKKGDDLIKVVNKIDWFINKYKNGKKSLAFVGIYVVRNKADINRLIKHIEKEGET